MRKIGRSRGEVADTIERFVQGICSRYEWDEFCSAPLLDPELDGVRLRCASLPQEHPSGQKGHYCSEEGINEMRRMMHALRQLKNP